MCYYDHATMMVFNSVHGKKDHADTGSAPEAAVSSQRAGICRTLLRFLMDSVRGGGGLPNGRLATAPTSCITRSGVDAGTAKPALQNVQPEPLPGVSRTAFPNGNVVVFPPRPYRFPTATRQHNR